MMERLRDQGGSPDRTIARAAELLAAVPPLDASRMRLPPPPPRDARAKVAAWRPRLAVGLAVMLASAVAAASGARLVFPGWLRSDAGASATPAIVSAAPAHAAPARVSATPARESSAVPVATPEPSNGGVAAPVRPSREGLVRAQPPRPPSESELIVQAVRALRREGDPALAALLAEEALRRYPHGAQTEEAMVLAMEAALARGDTSGGSRAASRYLDAFPTGRFADRARRAIGSP